jgi:hypothetical protein
VTVKIISASMDRSHLAAADHEALSMACASAPGPPPVVSTGLLRFMNGALHILYH